MQELHANRCALGSDQTTFRFECSLSAAQPTGRAILLVDIASGEELWVPFSQIASLHFPHERSGAAGFAVISTWIAKQKGLL